jgi:hypothetical protein
MAYPVVEASGSPNADRENLTERVRKMVGWDAGEVTIVQMQMTRNGNVIGKAEINAPPRRTKDE